MGNWGVITLTNGVISPYLTGAHLVGSLATKRPMKGYPHVTHSESPINLSESPELLLLKMGRGPQFQWRTVSVRECKQPQFL